MINVTLKNDVWNHGVNVEVRLGPDNGQDPGTFRKQENRVDAGDAWVVGVSDGFDLWYRRDKDPDNPRVPPDYESAYNHLINMGSDIEESIN